MVKKPLPKVFKSGSFFVFTRRDMVLRVPPLDFLRFCFTVILLGKGNFLSSHLMLVIPSYAKKRC